MRGRMFFDKILHYPIQPNIGWSKIFMTISSSICWPPSLGMPSIVYGVTCEELLKCKKMFYMSGLKVGVIFFRFLEKRISLNSTPLQELNTNQKQLKSILPAMKKLSVSSNLGLDSGEIWLTLEPNSSLGNESFKKNIYIELNGLMDRLKN